MPEGTRFTDLPPEIITNIYKNLDSPSSITALNSTSRQNYFIWKLNPTSISSAVIYNRFSSFSTALELLYLQEKILNVDFTSDRPPTDRLSEIQQEARDALSRDGKSGYQGASLNNGEYSTLLARNQALISNAKKAEHVCRVFIPLESKWITESGGCPDERKLHENFILAYYRVWILATLRDEETMDERLKSIAEDEADYMTDVMGVLCDDLPEIDRVYLGVSPPTTGLHGGNEFWTFEASWQKALIRL